MLGWHACGVSPTRNTPHMFHERATRHTWPAPSRSFLVGDSTFIRRIAHMHWHALSRTWARAHTHAPSLRALRQPCRRAPWWNLQTLPGRGRERKPTVSPSPYTCEDLMTRAKVLFLVLEAFSPISCARCCGNVIAALPCDMRELKPSPVP